MIIPVILAGGSGARLWPLSRNLYPKQLLNLTGQWSLLQTTVLRIIDADGIVEPIVICNESHRFIISDQLRQIGVRPNLILEPVGRNTAPAVAIAALKAQAADPDARILILPADHLIREIEQFHHALYTAAHYAERSTLVTFGVIPDSPETGYGYIRKGAAVGNDSRWDTAYAIRQFVEKPDLETAGEYVDSGEYCWNSGMFMFGAGDIIAEFERFAPDILEDCRAALDLGKKDGEALLLDSEAFGRCRSDSIDYSIMEKTDRGVMVPFSAGWNDIGSWQALWELGDKDEAGNVFRGDVLALDSENNLVYSQGRLVAVVGLRDVVIVESPDAVLVTGRQRSQHVKSIVDALKSVNRKEAQTHGKSYYPWGTVEDLEEDEHLVVRKVFLDKEAGFSLQGPEDRILTWVVVSGRAEIVKDGNRMDAGRNVSLRIDPGQIVEIRNSDNCELVLTEIFVPAGGGSDHFRTAQGNANERGSKGI